MSENESMIARIEEKIRTLGEELVSKKTENAALKEEINALKNKLTDLEEILDESGAHQNGQQADQIDSIKKELDKYIGEVEHCIDLVKQM